MRRRFPVLFIAVCMIIFSSCSVSPRDVSTLSTYDWGPAVVEQLTKIGVQSVSNLKVDKREIGTSGLAEAKISLTTEKDMRLKIELLYSSTVKDGELTKEWQVWYIKNHDSDKIYYDYYEETQGIGKPTHDIFDYKTGSIVLKADAEEKEKISETIKNNQQKEQQKKKDAEEEKYKNSLVDMSKMYKAYDKNELTADDKYKGNYYTFTGSFQTVKDDGLVNEVFDEIGVVVSVKTNTKKLIIVCKFDDTERDNLKKFSKGDIIEINGKCLSWGSWTDCKVVENGVWKTD